jgi:hypothetical protein
MAKGAASQAQVAALHAKIAEVLSAQLGETICVNAEEVEAGEAEAEVMFTASPALLTMAARFVKDNGVEVDIEETEGTSIVQERLAMLKRNRGKIVKLSDIHPVAADG